MDVTTSEIRALVDRSFEASVTSLYLNTDGARYPRTADYEARLDGLLREIRRAADDLGRAGAPVRADADAIDHWVRQEFDRGDTRGVGVFASGGVVVETVEVALGVRNVARVGHSPYVVPLEALLGRHHHIALAVVARDRARVFRYRLGRLDEHTRVHSEVHRQHDQGGWAQARYQRTIEHEKLLHMKDVAEVLRALHEEDPVDALVLSGTEAEIADFSPLLHPYLQQIVHGTTARMPIDANPEEVKELLGRVEQELVSSRRQVLLERLSAAAGQGERAARGVRHVVEAVNAKRIETLFVVEGAGEPGYRSETGALALHEEEAASYGTPVRPVPDVIDEVIEEAVRSGAHIELFRDPARLGGHVAAALLRF